MCMSYIALWIVLLQFSLVFVSFLSSLLFIADDRSCNLVMNTYNDILKIFDIDIIFDTLCERFFLAQLCLTRGHLQKVSSDV